MTRVRRNGRVLYGDGWSLTLYPWGAHLRRRREDGDARWRQYRLAFFARKPQAPGYVKFIDWSVRDTRTATSKPVRPCWRFWIGMKVGRHVDKSVFSRWYDGGMTEWEGARLLTGGRGDESCAGSIPAPSALDPEPWHRV